MRKKIDQATIGRPKGSKNSANRQGKGDLGLRKMAGKGRGDREQETLQKRRERYKGGNLENFDILHMRKRKRQKTSTLKGGDPMEENKERICLFWVIEREGEHSSYA